MKDTCRLSVAVIARNEADRILRMLDSVAFADEVLVVDSGSGDDTVEICRQWGARVIYNEWPGYAAQKQFALEQAKGDWVLSLDADEAVSEELAREISSILDTGVDDLAGFSIPRRSWYLGRWIRHGGWYPDRKVRLVRRGRAEWTGDGLHERLETDGTLGRLNGDILHYVYRDIADQVVTINSFSRVFAEEKGARGAGYLLAGLPHMFGKFLECYVWKLGFLDGLPGLVIAVNSSFYIFLKHAKAWELGLTTGEHGPSPTNESE